MEEEVGFRETSRTSFNFPEENLTCTTKMNSFSSKAQSLQCHAGLVESIDPSRNTRTSSQ